MISLRKRHKEVTERDVIIVGDEKLYVKDIVSTAQRKNEKRSMCGTPHRRDRKEIAIDPVSHLRGLGVVAILVMESALPENSQSRCSIKGA